ncbi:tRNA preQ1(34) S-adenosylmethionine ribosyltransferase-isomerase QueA [Oceanithermus sp.]
MRLEDYLYDLPEEKIAQQGVEPRDHSRLMVVERGRGVREHARFYDLPRFLRSGDLLVFNETKVIPARLFGEKEGGARVEALLVRQQSPERWWAMVKPGRRLKPGARVRFGPLAAEVVAVDETGLRLLAFDAPVLEHLADLGQTPLPPYIHRPVAPERYQTVYARREGSVAAPTAGLHFTPRLMDELAEMGVEQARIVLHVGPGTFQPVKGSIEEHRMHAEYYQVPAEAAALVNRALAEGRRVIAVGTTVVRTLESAFVPGSGLRPGAGETRLFIRPPYEFRVVGGLITNFHLPGSTLLMLVAAFAGYQVTMNAYREALRGDYRFFSLGDAMLIL